MTNIKKKPENCNYCIYKKNISKYLDMDDYCTKIMKHISKINMAIECPLRKKHNMNIFNTLRDRRKMEHRTEDIIQMRTDIVLADKEGKFIEVKVSKPEYMPDSIF